MKWNDLTKMPPVYTEVLVIIDGHRNSMWRNSFPLVAYLSPEGQWLQQQHPAAEPLSGVISWAYIEY